MPAKNSASGVGSYCRQRPSNGAAPFDLSFKSQHRIATSNNSMQDGRLSRNFGVVEI